MQVFFSVGEPSGDLHGANLIAALKQRRPEWRFTGYGGPRMAAAGCRLHFDLTKLAVMWVMQVIAHFGKFLKLLAEAERHFKTDRPDLVVLIDYPGFNWWIARKAKAQGIPVVYYGTPQLWAWASWRVRKMQRLVDHVLCKLPFEEKWFRKRGCHATFVGHPYFDELRSRRLDEQFLDEQSRHEGALVTLLPGSRTQEIKSNLPQLLKAGRLVQQQQPKTRLAIAVFKKEQLPLVRQLLQQSEVAAQIFVGRTAELIASARCCLACSGSVSLELLYYTRPSAILYQISRWGYFVQLIFRKVRYITLVNLLTAKNPLSERAAGIYDPGDPRDQHVLMPEYLTYEDRTAELARHALTWLTDDAAHAEVEQKLANLRDQVAQGGASERAADYLVEIAPAAAAEQPSSKVADAA